MDIWTQMKNTANEVKESGFCIRRGMLSDLELEWYNSQIEELKSGYSKLAVEQKMYRKRENTTGRLGDALIVTTEAPDTMPYKIITGGIASLYLEYINVLGYFVGETVPETTKVLFNYQFYKKGASNSLPFHFDAEIFKGDWSKEYIKLEEGLIPRLVMVVILENKNDGKGLQIMSHDGKITELELIAGDILYFDNTKVLHGVPEDLDEPRSMMGFRSFETKPLYFNKNGLSDGLSYGLLHDSEVIEIDTQYVKGEAVEISTEEAKEILKNEGWYYE